MNNKLNNKKGETIKRRIQKEKELILEQLKKTPIVQIACEKVGIARATYYRWNYADRKFSMLAQEAILEGSRLINDMAESQLLSAIRDKNMTAIIFWLKHHHPAYETRVEIRQAASQADENLTSKQKEVIRKALEVTMIDKKEKLEEKDKDEKK